jgi:hypothetical protein
MIDEPGFEDRLDHRTQRVVHHAIAERAPGVFDSYRPELHYMRGRGPKWREKHGLSARKKHCG